MKKFWMVVKVNGDCTETLGAPRIIHPDYMDATCEAQRLCEKEAGRFAVLEAVRGVKARAEVFEVDNEPENK